MHDIFLGGRGLRKVVARLRAAGMRHVAACTARYGTVWQAAAGACEASVHKGRGWWAKNTKLSAGSLLKICFVYVVSTLSSQVRGPSTY